MPETFLLNTRHPHVLHIWTGTDTVCRMVSTGGIKLSRHHQFTPIIGEAERVCKICSNLSKLQQFRKTLGEKTYV